jgi:hypothetical protein
MCPPRPTRLGNPAVEGERKQVTVLFADLKGTTELLAIVSVRTLVETSVLAGGGLSSCQDGSGSPNPSSIGRCTCSNCRQIRLVGDDDLRTLDADHIGIFQLAELPANIFPRESQIFPEIVL